MEAGFRCVDRVAWTNWQPGNEYRKALSIKNVSRVVQTLHWDPPSSPNFSTEYADPVRLNPDVTAVINITFKPTKLDNYEGNLTFSATKGSFSVALEGIVCTKSVQFPEELSFGNCAVKETTTKLFQFRNPGDGRVLFDWLVQPPFSISPKAGFLLPRQVVSATCSFLPEKACHYSAEALCITASDERLQMSLDGTGKYTFLRITPTNLEFGNVEVGSAKEMSFHIWNTSEVLARVQIQLAEGYTQPLSRVFIVDPTESSVQPKEHLQVKVLYCPLSTGTHSIGQIDVTSSLQCVDSLTCTGYALPPHVAISKYALDFGSVPLGCDNLRSLNVINMSNVHVSFQFMVSMSGVFRIWPVKGVIKPQSAVSIHIEFSPIEAANYYKRAICIVQDQHPLYCDLVGSCFHDKVNFPTLKPHHVIKYREQVNVDRTVSTTADSLGKTACFDKGDPNSSSDLLLDHPYQGSTCKETRTCSPSLSLYMGEPHIQSPFATCASSSDGSYYGKTQRICDKVSEQACTADELWEEYFLGKTPQCNSIEMEPTTLEFGVASHFGTTNAKDVTVKNNSSNTFICHWQTYTCDMKTPELVRSTGPWSDDKKAECIFEVSPQAAILLPHASITFHITFRPDKENQYYEDTLNLYISHSDKDKTLSMPPSLLYLQVAGNSFSCESQEFVPQAYFFPSKVLFPPVMPGVSAYQTVALRNQGCTPLRFSFKRECLGHVFSVKPSEGLVPEGSFQLISFRFNATTPSSHMVNLPCILNNMQGEAMSLPLVATCDIPQITLDSSTSILFKCSNIGVSVSRVITMKNLSNVPASFDWRIPPTFVRVFSVDPSSGIIMGKQKVKLTCSFCPASAENYCIQAPCFITPVIEKAIYSTHGMLVKRCPSFKTGEISATFQGQGRCGSVNVEPRELNLGSLIVGFPHRTKLSLYNSTNCTLDYMMDYISLRDTTQDDYTVKFDSSQGSIPCRSFKDITVTFKPKTASNFCVCIVCNAFPALPQDEKANQFAAMPHSILSARAMFPSLSLCGARAEGLSGAQMWRQLCLDELDLLLAQAEVKQNGISQDFFGLGAPENPTPPFSIYFGRSNLGTKPTTIELVFTTRSCLVVSWKIKLWNDKELDLENWVEEPEPNERERLYMTTSEQGLFQVSPKEGLLHPGEDLHIRFEYKHNLGGMHVLPAILQLENGSSLPLRIWGETLPRRMKILTAQDSTFVLKPVVIGTLNPPVQTFELRNDGLSELEYSIDLDPLMCLQKDNYNFNVLVCLNPSGIIPPNETVLLNWIFRPIQAKEYSVDLLISVEHGEGVLLSIRGSGITKLLEVPERRKDSRDGASTPKPNPKACQWTGLPAMLSTEHLIYKEVQMLSSSGKLVAVRNFSLARIGFFWHCSFAADRSVYGHFSVIPSEGVIECGKSCVCKITFTAGMHPQIFETTLYCHVWEMPLETVVRETNRNIVEERDEEVLEEDWNQLGSVTFNKNQAHHCVMTNLTHTVKQKFPRLAQKKHLCFASTAASSTDVQESSLQRGVLYLTVSLSIQAAEGDAQSRVPTEPVTQEEEQHLQEKCCTEGEVIELLLKEMLQQGVKEVMEEGWLEAQGQDQGPLFFEQFQGIPSTIGDCSQGKQPGIVELLCSSKKAWACKMVCPQHHVDEFELPKQMLEFMLFDVLKDLHDENQTLLMNTL